MSWLETVLNRLAATSQWTYLPVGPRAAEPAALAALALVAHGRTTAAHAALDWLVGQQSPDGAVGIVDRESNPAWTTACALLAWQAADGALPGGARRRAGDRQAIARGVDWLLTARGKTAANDPDLGHDATLAGWPWVLGTHSWIEPTAMAVLALRASGEADHPRASEAVRLLVDRLLPDGGCNYGNTFVLGQELRAHIQPTGVCLWALAGANDSSGRVAKTIDYLERSTPAQTATASLCYALLGLAAHGRRPATSEGQLAAAAERTLQRAPSTYRLALLALAAPHEAVSVIPATAINGAAPAAAAERRQPSSRGAARSNPTRLAPDRSEPEGAANGCAPGAPPLNGNSLPLDTPLAWK